MSQHRVLILGGGFGGVKAALELAGHRDINVSLVTDRHNFRYYPMLYHAATGGNPVASIIPQSEIFTNRPVHVVYDTALALDKQNRVITGKKGKYGYDYLIIALGSVTNYFGIKGLAEYSFGLKTQEEAQELRAHLHKVVLDKTKTELNYVIIGGGPTGVELAGALPAYLRHVQKRHKLPQKPLHIDLVEAAPRLMPKMHRAYSYAAQKRLKRLGVRLFLSEKVEAETADRLKLSNHSIKSHTVVWTAGVTNHPFLSDNNFAVNEHGKVLVDENLRVAEHIFVIGDNADTAFSGMAQTAIRDAIFVANNLKRMIEGMPMLPYEARKPVYITPAGRHWAAVSWGNLHIYGWAGWALRRAADFIAYHDLEPWWKAYKHWEAEDEKNKECQICR